MNFSMLGLAGWDSFSDTPYSWLTDVFNYLYPTLYAIMAVAAAAGAIYAVWLGIQLAKAEDQSKRDEAKKRLIYTLVAVAVVILLIVFFNELLPGILDAVGIGKEKNPNDNRPGESGFISPVLTFVKTFIR